MIVLEMMKRLIYDDNDDDVIYAISMFQSRVCGVVDKTFKCRFLLLIYLIYLCELLQTLIVFVSLSYAIF